MKTSLFALLLAASTLIGCTAEPAESAASSEDAVVALEPLDHGSETELWEDDEIGSIKDSTVSRYVVGSCKASLKLAGEPNEEAVMELLRRKILISFRDGNGFPTVRYDPKDHAIEAIFGGAGWSTQIVIQTMDGAPLADTLRQALGIPAGQPVGRLETTSCGEM